VAEVVATTELDAVNEMLSIVGEAPVNSLDTGTADVLTAKRLLDRTNRFVQSKGFTWNTEYGHQILPDSASKFPVQTNWITAKPRFGAYGSRILVQRGGFMYDTVGRTYTPPLSKVVVDVVVQLPWADLPETARYYIQIRAGRIYMNRQLGIAEMDGYARGDEMMAWAALQEEDARYGNYSIFKGATAADVLARGRTNVSGGGGHAGGGDVSPLPPIA
jgi:hypothetical protein